MKLAVPALALWRLPSAAGCTRELPNERARNKSNKLLAAKPPANFVRNLLPGFLFGYPNSISREAVLHKEFVGPKSDKLLWVATRATRAIAVHSAEQSRTVGNYRQHVVDRAPAGRCDATTGLRFQQDFTTT